MSDLEHFSLNFSNANENPLDQQNSCQVLIQSSGSKCRTRRAKKEQEYLHEIWSVQQVPIDFGGISKSSAVVEKVLESRKADHDVALESLEKELDRLHEKCKTEVDDLNKNLQIEIEKYHANIEDEKNDFCSLMGCTNDEKYEDLRDKIESVMEKERTAIDRLFELVQRVEFRKRSEATQIIKKYHLILRKLFYLQKDALRKLMEHKILEYNRMAIENHKKYEELKLNLYSSADTYKQNFYLWMKKMKEDKNATCRQSALNEFYTEYDNLQNAGAVYFKTIEGKSALCRLKSRKSIISETIAQWDMTVPYSASRFEEHSNQINSIISSTDATVTSFIKSYQFYMSRHLGRLSNKIEKLQATLGDDSEIAADQESEATQKIYDGAKEQIERFVAESEETWNQILNKLRDTAVKTFKLFQDFGSPWDVQATNYSKLQITTIEQLKNRAAKSESAHLDLQEKINAEIVKLREEESVSKLEKRLAQVLALLDRKIEKYKHDFEEDCKIIRKCKETVKKELSGMQNKIDTFLQANKPVEISENVSLSSYQSAEDHCFCQLSLEDIISHELQLIEKQIDAFEFWRATILKNMASYRSFMEKEILEIVDTWQEELILEGSQFVDENLKTVEQLGEDIRTEAYTVRLNELTSHQQNIERHKKLITRLLNESSKCTDSFLDFNEVIGDYKSEALQMIEEYGPKTKHSSQVQCLKNMLRTLKEDYKKKIDQIVNCNIDRLMKKISLIKMSNESFLDAIILFADGGNFDTEELNLARKEIDALLKAIQIDESNNRSKIKKIADQVNSQIDDVEKVNSDSLSITLNKLRLQENINNAITKCEYVVSIRRKHFREKNKEIIEMIVAFITKCQNRLSADDLILDLTKLAQTSQKHVHFIKGPFPNIDIPKIFNYNSVPFNSNNNDNNNNNGATTRRHSKRRKSSIKPMINQQNNQTQNDQYDSNNFASVIAKLIKDTLSVIDEKAVEYYTLLKNKREHQYFPDNNEGCEDCINNTLQRLNSVFETTFNFWITEINDFLNFFKSVEIPSLDYYLNSEYTPDKKESSETLNTEVSNPNKAISIKIDENFVEFQDILQGMLNLLQSKSMNSECEKAADDKESSN
ncbi:putative WEB family protein At1g65010, chloroplastic isoform X2 [Nasonia vitripennis]|uniref:DUF4455 domain-containing protein n=1 Tax=Nasonia vitripennis TaxID=7425 RepID=A0A7M7GKD9_NASVI|nr:putative WEB family protein At1g65010, chloroplastic isoform X2 [Nasonia vitripennis]